MKLEVSKHERDPHSNMSRVESLLLRSDEALSIDAICKTLRLSAPDANNAIKKLVTTHRAHNTQARGAVGLYRWGRDSKVAIPRAKAKDTPTSGVYDGAELRPVAIPAARFHAFTLPSLVNGVLVAPRRPAAMCVGHLADKTSNAR